MTAPPLLSETAVAVCMASLLFVPLAGAGLALINSGLGRSRNAAHTMMASLCVLAIAAVAYFIAGFAWQGFAGWPAHAVTVAGKSWSWISAGHFFFRGLALNGSPASLAAWFGMLSAGLAALIPLGSGAERWRLRAACASTVLLAGWTYPLFAHWAWGGGWLAQLGANGGLGRGFVDAGGSGVIQVVGGLTALSIAWILGPRRGKYAAGGMPAAIPGHNVVLVLLGCLLALPGWAGLNSAGSLLFLRVEPGRVVLIAVNTTLAAAMGALAAGMTSSRFGKPDASLTANGWISGLVASSAGCALVTPLAAAAIGLVAGGLAALSAEWFELRFAVDDPSGAVSVHAVGGIWGVMAAGFWGRFPAGAMGGSSGQWVAQLVGIATLLGFVFPLTYALNRLLNRFCPYRVEPEGERQGLDLYELGAGAYPEFITHTDDLTLG